jgi:hypothetical protein
MRGQPTSWLGLGLAAWSNRGSSPRHGNGVRKPGTLAVRSLRASCACDDVVACSPVAQWQMGSGKVLW